MSTTSLERQGLTVDEMPHPAKPPYICPGTGAAKETLLETAAFSAPVGAAEADSE